MRPTYGLRPTREVVDGKLRTRRELHPVKAPIARQMFRLAVEENLGYKGIADQLTQLGFLGREGRPFASFTLQRVLVNGALAGTLVYGKKPRKGNPQQELVRVPGFFPAILSPEEWQRLQERLSIRRESSRGRTHTSEYLLSGIARCGQCGGPMSGKKAAVSINRTRLSK